MLSVKKLTCGGMVNPMGISLQYPSLSWQIVSDQRGTMQSAFRVRISEDPALLGKEDGICFYDSGKADGCENLLRLPRRFFKSGVRYYWQVQVWDNFGETAVSEEEAWMETGLLYPGDWVAKWIEPKQKPVVADRPGLEKYLAMDDPDPDEMDEANENFGKGVHNAAGEQVMHPCPMLRRDFVVKGPVKSVRVYATAHGIYRLSLNGQRVGDYEFAPECSCYDDYLQVQTYDITSMVTEGRNAIGAVLADGWWAGRIGNDGWSAEYGDKLALLLQIHMTYADGTEDIVGTDEKFVSAEGPWRYSDYFMGEKYDANFEYKNWSMPGYKNSLWQAVDVADYGYENLTGQDAEPMRVLETLTDARVYVSPKGELMIDCGQAMAGNASMHVQAQPGAVIKFSYSEETDKDGNYWFECFGANSVHEDYYVVGPSGEGLYDPAFTSTGFRYIKVECDRGPVEVSDIKARLIGSDLAVTAKMSCSNPVITKLQKNIVWTLRSNIPSIPTDDSDRERAGWSGDTQMSAPTFCYNLDGRAFYRRWLKYIEIEQKDSGAVPNIIPNWKQYQMMPLDPSAGWGDVAVLLPWLMYERFGDAAILEECYPMMKKFVDYVTNRAAEKRPAGIEKMTPEEERHQQYLWNGDFNFGDWLTPSACYNEETGQYTYFTQTLTDITGSYYFTITTDIMGKVAELLGKPQDAAYYRTLNGHIREAFIEEIYKKGKILESEYMGAQVFALHMGLYPEGDKEKVFNRLVELIEKRGMDTGFLSTKVVFNILAENGRPDLAYNFMLNDKFPSWIYEVDHGATTLWESMQAIMPDGTRQAVSFILPTFCPVGEWMISGVCGIKPAAPGFKKIFICPQLSDRLTWAQASYDSVQGRIFSRWEKVGEAVTMNIEIPANTTAEILLPKAQKESVLESGHPLSVDNGIFAVAELAEGVLVCAGSGAYCFEFMERR